MAKKRGVSEGKAEFLESFLAKSPDATLKIVNEAWAASGKEGTISQSYFGAIRTKLKLAKPALWSSPQ